nr:hypothetical protein [Orientia tsutsugamushi]
MHNSNIIGYWCSSYYTQGIALIRESSDQNNIFTKQEITVDSAKIKLSIPQWQIT